MLESTPKFFCTRLKDTNIRNVAISTEKSDNNQKDVLSVLNDIRIKNVNKLIVGNLNINSYEGKFDQFTTIIKNNLDIVVITETKLDDSYPDSQFFIDGFSKPYRMDRNKHGGGVLIYIKEGIPRKQLYKHNFTTNIEGMFIEINLRKTKWLLFGTYHPPSDSDKEYCMYWLV